MKSETVAELQPKTDEDYKAEIERMIPEIEAMLTNARRMSEESRHIGQENRRMLDVLEQRLLCGKN